jgi:hypothetical protein
MDQASRRLIFVESRHVMNAGLRAPDNIDRWLAERIRPPKRTPEKL